MALIRRDNLASPQLERQTVPMPELGGDVIVRALTLTERLSLTMIAGVSNVDRLPKMLSMCVLDADDNPLWTPEQWNVFGGKNPDRAFDLWDIARRLSGIDDQVPEGGSKPEEETIEGKSDAPK